MIEYMKQIINAPHPIVHIYIYMYIEILAEQNNKYLQSIDINNHAFIIISY